MGIEKIKNGVLQLTYLLGFLFYLHSYLPAYINSSFLEQYINERAVGILFIISSIIAIFGFIYAEKLLVKYGNYKIMFTGVFINFLLTLVLALSDNPLFILPIFVLGQLFLRILLFSLDILLENNTEEIQTGKIRGIFMTLTSIALVISPFIAGVVIENGSYKSVYFLSAIIMLPILVILFSKFRKFNETSYSRSPIRESVAKILEKPDLVRIFSSNLILRTFYAFMVIYSPIYLHERIGFSWEQIGAMFTFMLLPFVLFEIPLGKLADTRFGEKEMLSIGFIITGLSTASIFLIHNNSLVLWAILLFVTRTGASIIEIMTETYFFKKVSPNDSDIIGTYRMVDPVAYIIGPVIGTLILSITSDARFIFLVTGIILISGLRFSMLLRDTL